MSYCEQGNRCLGRVISNPTEVVLNSFEDQYVFILIPLHVLLCLFWLFFNFSVLAQPLSLNLIVAYKLLDVLNTQTKI